MFDWPLQDDMANASEVAKEKGGGKVAHQMYYF